MALALRRCPSLAVVALGALAFAGCGTSAATRTVTTAASSSVSVAPTTSAAAAPRPKSRHHAPRHKARAKHGYVTTYPAGYASHQVAGCIATKAEDPSLMPSYCHCVIGTLMRRVPYAVQQHTEPASKVGLPATWWSSIVSRCLQQQ